MASEKSHEIQTESTHSGNAHRHHRAFESSRRLSIVLILTTIYAVAEAFGGWWTGSLALFACREFAGFPLGCKGEHEIIDITKQFE